MLGQAKLILGSLSALVMGILYAVFKARGKEIDKLNEENSELKRHKEVNDAIIVVNEEVYEQYKYQEDQIEDTYEESISKIYKAVDKPLTPSFLERLRTVQGLQDRPDSPPE